VHLRRADAAKEVSFEGKTVEILRSKRMKLSHLEKVYPGCLQRETSYRGVHQNRNRGSARERLRVESMTRTLKRRGKTRAIRLDFFHVNKVVGHTREKVFSKASVTLKGRGVQGDPWTVGGRKQRGGGALWGGWEDMKPFLQLS